MKKTILNPAQKQLWGKVAGAKWLAPFYLAGGTGLALQLHHRESIDFDFFSKQEFDVEKISAKLTKIGKLEILSLAPDTLNVILSGVKISFLFYRYDTLSPPVIYDRIAIASISDIGCMKMIAIAQRGAKKDFIDLYTIIKSGMNLEALFEAVERKFSDVEYNKLYLLKSLTYFADAESDMEPKMFIPETWENIKHQLRAMSSRVISKVENP